MVLLQKKFTISTSWGTGASELISFPISQQILLSPLIFFLAQLLCVKCAQQSGTMGKKNW